LGTEINKQELLENGHFYLAKIYKEKNDLEQALYHNEKSYEILQDRFDSKIDKRIRQLQVQFEVERKEKETEMYRLKAEQQKKELSLYLKNLADKNELIHELQQEIIELQDGKTPSQMDMANSILQRLKGGSIREEWHLFQDEFDKIYPNFISRLTQKYPKLTRQEIRVCALIKLNLTTKEIANVFYIHPKTVSKHRQRIRKKLNLLPEVGLTPFITAF
jgi:DNA-binding CsgD family transcriptional regulator